MENFITVFIIVFIVLVSVARKIISKQTPKQGSGSSAGVGWVSKINTFINDIQKRIDAQQPQASPTSAHEWQQLMEEDAPSRRQEMMMDDLAMEDEYDITDHPEEKPLGKKLKTGKMSSPRYTVPAELQKAEGKTARRIPLLGTTTDRRDLRNAVIWSEILGPPVALKQPSGDRF